MNTAHIVWFACEEDVDAAIDEAVDRYAAAPDLRPLEEGEPAEACFWCGGTPRYRVEVSAGEDEEQENAE